MALADVRPAVNGNRGGRRVLFANATGYFAGAEVMLVDLASGLRDRGWQPLVLVPFDGLLSAALRQRRIDVRLWPLAAPHTRRELYSAGALWRLARRAPGSILGLARLIRRERIDLVHTNSSAVFDAALAARLAGVPHIWHVRERLPLGARLRSLLCRAMLILSARVICISRAVAAQWGRNAGHPKLDVLPDGLDLASFVPSRSPAAVREALGAGRGPLVGLVGRINPIKGQDVFLEAAERLAGDFPEAHFVLAGGALAAYENLQRDLIARAGRGLLAGRVTFTGTLAREAVADLMPALDVLAVPTSSMEGFGLVALEAMACGVPVVATHGGPDDLVVQGETGYLVPAGDAEALAVAIGRLLADPAHARRLGAAGRCRAQAEFTLARHVARVEALYEEVLSSGKIHDSSIN